MSTRLNQMNGRTSEKTLPRPVSYVKVRVPMGNERDPESWDEIFG